MTRIEQDAARMLEASAPGLRLHRASSITCRPFRWLWDGFLARGKLHILAGAPGTGKTTIALALAAAVSRGSEWPDGTRAPRGNILVWSGEDDAADTLVPRLRAAGADLNRVWILGDVAEGEEPRSFDPAQDIALLEDAAAELGDVALLVADPVVSAVAGDSHKNTEVRRALQPLVNLAQRLDCAVLGVSHFSKGSAGRDPTERVTGSVAFGALPRVVMVAARRNTEEGADERIFARAKSNIGPDGGGFGYRLEMADADGMPASRVCWGDALEGTARELLAEAEDATPASDAGQWLADTLAAGPVAVTEIKAEARAAGFGWRSVEAAKAELNAVSERVSHGNAGGGLWQWRLPGKSATATPQSPFQNLAVLPEASNGAGLSVGNTARPQDRTLKHGLRTCAEATCPACDGEGCRHCESPA